MTSALPRRWGLFAPKPPRIFAEQYENIYNDLTVQAGMPMAVNSMAVTPCGWPLFIMRTACDALPQRRTAL